MKIIYGCLPPSDAIASHRFRLFALNGTSELGRDISNLLGHHLSAHEEREFEDGEHKARPLDPVGGRRRLRDPQPSRRSANKAPTTSSAGCCSSSAALKDAGARRVTAVAPYLCYARKDRRTKANDPVTTRYTAALFEAIGCDAVVTLEVHNEAAFENAFRCRAVALTAAPLMIARIKATVGEEPLCVISPDLGGGKRADLLREALETVMDRPIGKAFAEKHRSAGIVSGDLFVGDVAGATCIIVDDLISTGGTLVRAARAARARGARRVLACVAHGLFMPGAETALADPAIDRIIATDVVPPFRLPAGPVRDKLDIVPAAPLLAEAIRRLHEDKPLGDLLVF